MQKPWAATKTGAILTVKSNSPKVSSTQRQQRQPKKISATKALLEMLQGPCYAYIAIFNVGLGTAKFVQQRQRQVQDGDEGSAQPELAP